MQNILGIVDSSGNLVVKYKCDAWGNHSACNPDGRVNNSETFIGNINPFRYKGYYYDTDTDMYYCKSRYYNPVLGRYISPDSIEYLDSNNINGMNLYAYCGNNPVNYVDPDGHMPKWAQWLVGGLIVVGTIALAAVTFGAGAAIGVAASAVISGTMGVMTAQPGEDLVGSFLGGAITGAISTFAIAAGATIGALAFGGGALATVCGLGASFVGGFIAGMAGNAYSQKVSYGKVDWKVASVTGFFNGITSSVSSYVIMAAPLISTALKPSLYFKEALKFSLVGASVGVYLSSLIPNFNDKRNK